MRKRSRAAIATVVAGVALAVGAVVAQAAGAVAGAAPSVAAADATRGQDVYRIWCYDCHASTGGRYVPPAGFTVLSKRYGADKPGDLALRTDLEPAYIRTMVRNGLNVMPRTRKTEVTERELDDLIAYLTRNKP